MKRAQLDDRDGGLGSYVNVHKEDCNCKSGYGLPACYPKAKTPFFHVRFYNSIMENGMHMMIDVPVFLVVGFGAFPARITIQY